MKTAVTYAYTFTPGNANVGTLNLASIPSFNIKKLYSVVNVTANEIIYAAGLAQYGLFSLVGSTLTLAKNTSAMNNTDQLLIIYDDDTQVIKTDGSAVTQPVSGSVDVTPTTPAANDYLPVRLTNGTAFYEAGGGGGGGNGAILDGVDSAIKATVTASLALKVDGSAVTQPMSAASLPLPTGASTEGTLSSMSGKLPATLGTKTIANSLAVNIASDQTVPVSGPLTDTQLRAASVPVSGPLTDTQLRASSVPVTGPLTDTQLRATAVPVSGPLTDTQLRATAVPVSGTVSANATLSAETTKVIGTVNIAASQSVTSNAGTNTSTANLDVALSTRLKPADTLTGVTTVSTVTNLSQLGGAAVSMNTGVRDAGTQRVTIATNDSVPVTGPLTDTQLRATAVPVSGTVSANATLTAETTKVIGTVNIAASQSVGLTVMSAANSNPTGVVSLGNSLGKTNVLKTGTLVTTAVTADQVILTYTVTAGKTFYLEYFDISCRLTTFAATATNFGNTSLENPSGTKLYTQMASGSGVVPSPLAQRFSEPVPIAAGTVIRIVCTPSATTSFTWIANFGGYEK